MNNKTKRRTRLARVKTGELSAGRHLISSNVKRNMGMFVYVNEGPGGKDSITRHEPLEDGKPFRPYQRRKKVRVGGAEVERN